MDNVIGGLMQFLRFTGFANMTYLHILMIACGILVIVMSIRKDWEPLLLVPIGFGMIIGNIPFPEGLQIGIY
jgi:oxaloacetate decarboxylase beta subunit